MAFADRVAAYQNPT